MRGRGYGHRGSGRAPPSTSSHYKRPHPTSSSNRSGGTYRDNYYDNNANSSHYQSDNAGGLNGRSRYLSRNRPAASSNSRRDGPSSSTYKHFRDSSRSRDDDRKRPRHENGVGYRRVGGTAGGLNNRTSTPPPPPPPLPPTVKPTPHYHSSGAGAGAGGGGSGSNNFQNSRKTGGGSTSRNTANDRDHSSKMQQHRARPRPRPRPRQRSPFNKPKHNVRSGYVSKPHLTSIMRNGANGGNGGRHAISGGGGGGGGGAGGGAGAGAGAGNRIQHRGSENLKIMRRKIFHAAQRDRTRNLKISRISSIRRQRNNYSSSTGAGAGGDGHISKSPRHHDNKQIVDKDKDATTTTTLTSTSTSISTSTAGTSGATATDTATSVKPTTATKDHSGMAAHDSDTGAVGGDDGVGVGVGDAKKSSKDPISSSLSPSTTMNVVVKKEKSSSSSSSSSKCASTVIKNIKIEVEEELNANAEATGELKDKNEKKDNKDKEKENEKDKDKDKSTSAVIQQGIAGVDETANNTAGGGGGGKKGRDVTTTGDKKKIEEEQQQNKYRHAKKSSENLDVKKDKDKDIGKMNESSSSSSHKHGSKDNLSGGGSGGAGVKKFITSTTNERRNSNHRRHHRHDATGSKITTNTTTNIDKDKDRAAHRRDKKNEKSSDSRHSSSSHKKSTNFSTTGGNHHRSHSKSGAGVGGASGSLGATASNSNYIKLTCVHCHSRCLTFKEYVNHLHSYKHKNAIRQLAIRQKAHLLRLRSRQRAAQRDIEGKSKEEYESKFCHLCRLHYRQPKAKHQLSENHKIMKKFLMPYCSICHVAFKSPMQYEIHRCSLDHIRKKANASDNEDDSSTEMREIDLKKYLTVDSVGEIDDIDIMLTDVDADTDADADADADAIDNNDDVSMFNDYEDVSMLPGNNDNATTSRPTATIPLGMEFVKRVETFYCELCHRHSIANPMIDNLEIFAKKHCAQPMHIKAYLRMQAADEEHKNIMLSNGCLNDINNDDDHDGNNRNNDCYNNTTTTTTTTTFSTTITTTVDATATGATIITTIAGIANENDDVYDDDNEYDYGNEEYDDNGNEDEDDYDDNGDDYDDDDGSVLKKEQQSAKKSTILTGNASNKTVIRNIKPSTYDVKDYEDEVDYEPNESSDTIGEKSANLDDTSLTDIKSLPDDVIDIDIDGLPPGQEAAIDVDSFSL